MTARRYRSPELRANRLLRRVDWRFLLTDPYPDVSICFAGGPLRDAVRAISGRVLPSDQRVIGGCDLAVAADPDQHTLHAVATALRPGGACYTEWTHPLIGGPVRIRRLLVSVGLEAVRCYFVWPRVGGGHNPLFWLPLEIPEAASRFVTARSHDRSSLQRLRRAATRAVWRLAARGNMVFPICVVARKPLVAAQLDRGYEASDISCHSGDGPYSLVDVCRQEVMPGVPPDHLSCLLLTGGGSVINKVVGLVFFGGEQAPRVAVKMPRIPGTIEAVRHEAVVLDSIHPRHAGGMPGVPHVLFYREHQNVSMLGESVLEGKALFTHLRRDTYRDLAYQATDWLATLAGHDTPQPVDGWWERLISPVILRFRESYGAVVAPALLSAGEEQLSHLTAFPLVVEHRDFSPWNVLLDAAGDLVVLDWESAELQGLPFLDLIYFLSYLAFFHDGAMVRPDLGRVRASYRASLDPATFTGGVVASCVARYARQLGLEPAALQPLRLLTWMIHSHSEYLRLVGDNTRPLGPQQLRQGVFINLWEEELRSAQG